jgi:hypothetical protein
MTTEWYASPRDHSGETWAVTRSFVNGNGKWELERVRKIFRTEQSAQRHASHLNQK